MKKKIVSKISVQLIFAVAISFIVSLLWAILVSQYVYSYYLLNQSEFSTGRYNIVNLTLLAVEISIFVLVFLILINRKIKYIKYSSLMVKDIANGNLGATLEIKGSDELAELCMSINSMSKELKKKFDNERQMEEVKNELITNVSHDLRTPLTSIVGYVDLLRKKEYKSKEQFDEYIDTIYNKSKGLQMLINELFEYTKLATPGIKVNKNNIDLSGLLRQLIGEYIPIFNREGITFKIDIPEQDIIVSIDIEKMVRVLDNILINAKKYSVKPSDILVKLHNRNNKAVVSVSNRADEIPIENLNMLFEKFYRVDTSRTNNDGTGLGLAIAKRIVELHDGKIWAEYKAGIITFFVELDVQDKMKGL